MRPHPNFVGNSITLPGGYHASFVASGNSAVAVAGSLAAVLNAASSPVTAVVGSGGTASAATVTLTSKAAGASQNGPIGLSLVTTQVKAAPASLSGGAGTSYDVGTVTVNVNGATLTVPYGQTSTAQTVVGALASAIDASSGLGVTATAGRGAALTVTANQAGTAGNGIAVTLSSSTSEPGLFSSPSYSGNSGTLSGGVDPAATPGAIYNYTIPSPPTPSTGYAGNGNLLSFTDMVNGQWTVGYDTLNRLTSATLAGQPTYAWTYDAFGNRTSSSPNGGATNYPLPINRSSAWQYDFSGRVIDDGSNQYTYDGEGRLCVAYNKTLVSYTGYAYDGLGNRVARGAVSGPGCNNSLTASQTFVVGINGELLDTLSASGAVSSNVQANGQLLATYQYGAGSWSYALNDWLGTKRVVANADGTIQETCLGLPFGDGLNCTGTDASTLHFTGKERDAESGLDYFGARYYGSNMGRFMSPDYDDEDDDPNPVPYADLTNPQTLNLYGYVTNNPLRLYDPTGHDGCCDVLPSMEEVDAGIAYLEGGLETAATVSAGAVMGSVGFIGSQIFAPAQMGNDPAERAYLNRARTQSPSGDHTKDARPSTKGKHQKGQGRKKKDKGGEKGDAARKKNGMYSRKPPGGVNPKGGWPPKDDNNFNMIPVATNDKDNSTVTTTQEDHLPPPPPPQPQQPQQQ